MPRLLRFEWDVPDGLFDEQFREEEFLQGLKEEAVLKLFQAGRITSGSGAKLLGMTRRDFLELLYRRGVPYFRYSPQQFRQELEAVEQLGEELEKRGDARGT
ncbi:MAG: UPF0175 family protein [candidate division NC10 bacterium]|nr:UPF0175 family protein [candidate division NC10 bacterium]